jgi:hypothetical protein
MQYILDIYGNFGKQANGKKAKLQALQGIRQTN